MDLLDFSPREDKRNIASFRRESSFWKSLSLIDLDAGREVASVRFYGAAQTVYCVAWIWHLGAYGYGDPIYSARGYGKAGGYGYHKPSAAMQEALNAAGMTFDQDIAGRGDGLMEDALRALADHLGIKRPMVLAAHT